MPTIHRRRGKVFPSTIRLVKEIMLDANLPAKEAMARSGLSSPTVYLISRTGYDYGRYREATKYNGSARTAYLLKTMRYDGGRGWVPAVPEPSFRDPGTDFRRRIRSMSLLQLIRLKFKSR